MHRSNLPGHARGALAIGLSLFTVPCLAAETPLAFRTAGGDAWTFDKRVEALVPAGQCDDVVIASPRGVITAAPSEGKVVAQVPLAAGDNTVTAECRRRGQPTGATAYQTWHVRLNNVPKARVRLEIGKNGVELSGNASEPAPAAAAPIVRYEWRDSGRTALSGLPADGPRILLPAPVRDGEYRVTLRIVDAADRADESTTSFRVVHGRAQSADPAHAHPSWIEDAVVYGVVPTLFGGNAAETVA